MNQGTKTRLRAIEVRLRPGEAPKDIWITTTGLSDWDGWEISGAEPVQIMREGGETDEALRERVQAYLDAHRKRGAIRSLHQIGGKSAPNSCRITRGGIKQ